MPADVAAASRQVIADYGPPDILVNNAGFATYRTFEQEFPDEMERLYNVNFGGALRVTKAFLQGMIKRSSGHIVNIASIAGAMTITPNAVYGGAKHGMMAWSKCIAIELARFGVNVHVICPGRVETSFFDHETFRMRAHRKETELTIPIEEVVQAIIDTILHNKAVRFVPRYYGLLAWALHAFGPLVQGPMDRLLRARIEDLYRNRDKQ
ncbi:MAG: uncharacterized protein QOF19_2906 [Alphaproteobacteria bacterium]|nr:uncharacterized protein [Alphaproteobacteria bacterium]